jgi:signal transduction histidine kinase
MKVKRSSMKYPTAVDVGAVQSISAVPTILRMVAETTGMRFVCVARVDADSWTSCAVLDEIGFGLEPGGVLDVATTLCDEVRAGDSLIVIDHASKDPVYCDHPTPKLYGFESYISVPVRRANGEFFGTLCALDPRPAQVSNPKVVDTLLLLADLISRQLEDEQRLSESESALLSERETAELREQFIAVLGHDLRTPLSSIMTGTELLRRLPLDQKALAVVERIGRSGRRMSSLVDDVVDFTRGRMGGGIPMNATETHEFEQQVRHVIAELQDLHPERSIVSDIAFDGSVFCDTKRIAQLLSNLLVNALNYGAADQPVRVVARNPERGLFLSVSNAGTPITEEKMFALFQPFRRGKNASMNGGLGLGLYIASEIARSHGGVLSVTSSDEATTFTFSMPPIARD